MRNFLLTAAALLLFAQSAAAQIHVRVVMSNPTQMPREIERWTDDPSLFQIIIQSMSSSSHSDLRFSFQVLGASYGGEVVSSNNGSPSQPRFSLGPMETRTFLLRDLVDERAITYPSSLRDKIARDGIPEDHYQFCAEILDPYGRVFGSTGAACPSFSIVVPDPPTIVFPDKMQIDPAVVPLRFQWTPVASPGVQYRLVVKPLFAGQDPVTALQANPLLLEKTVHATSYQYLPSDPTLDLYPSTVGYVWQVQSVVHHTPIGRNQGKSPVASFTTAAPQNEAPTTMLAGGSVEASGECGDPCAVPLPENKEVADVDPDALVGKELQIGRFVMLVEEASGSGTSIDGRGLVKVPFLKAALRVTFSGLAINEESQVLRGKVVAVAEGNLLPSGWADDFTRPFQSGDRSAIDRVREYITLNDRIVSVNNGETPIGLPIGLDRRVDGAPWVISVVGAEFTPTQAKLNAVLGAPMPDFNSSIQLAAKGICITPGGLAGGNARLQLIEDVEIKLGEITNRFLAKENGGTYADWKCDGFESLTLAAEQEFPHTWLVPVNSDGEQREGAVKARYQGKVTRMNGWVLSGKIDRAGLGSSQFWFDEADVTIDNSYSSNRPGMQFPSGYLGTQGPAWRGLHIPNLTFHTPPGMRSFSGSKDEGASVRATNLVIDHSGVSIAVDAYGLLSLGSNLDNVGTLGGWRYSIDRLQFDMVSNSVKKAEFNGHIQLPISETPVAYEARYGLFWGLSYLQFALKPRGPLTATFLGSQLTIKEGSTVMALANKDGAYAHLTLNGVLTVGGGVLPGGMPGNITGLEFGNLQLSTEGPNFVRNTGYWKPLWEWRDVAGMPLYVRNIKLSSRTSGNCLTFLGLDLEAGIYLNPTSVFSGSTTLGFEGLIECPQPRQPFKAKYFTTHLRGVKLAGDLGFMRVVDSYVNFFRDHTTYGNGVQGRVGIEIMRGQQVTGAARFGQIRNIPYGSVDLMYKSDVPFAMIGPVGIHGVGGGFAYNLTRRSELPTPATLSRMASGSTSYAAEYTPQLGASSFRLSSTLSALGSTSMFNADATLELEMGYNFSMRKLSLFGNFWALSPGLAYRSQAGFDGSLDVAYDFQNRTLWGYSLARSGREYQKYGVSASGWAMLYSGPYGSYFRIGEPAYPVSMKALGFGLNAYFAAGSPLPEIPPPPGAAGKPRREFNAAYMKSPGGMVFGASAEFKAKSDYGAIYGELQAVAGLDLGIYNWGAHAKIRTEKNTVITPIGFQGWYGAGQVYAHLSGRVGVRTPAGRFEIADASATAVLSGGFPRPAWARGSIYGYYRILGGNRTYFDHYVQVGTGGNPTYN